MIDLNDIPELQEIVKSLQDDDFFQMAEKVYKEAPPLIKRDYDTDAFIFLLGEAIRRYKGKKAKDE